MGSYLKAIPPHIQQLLQNKFGKKLTEIKGREVKQRYEEVKKRILVRKEEKAGYTQHFKAGAAVPIRLFSQRSFKRYLKSAPVHTDKLNALLFFLDIEPHEFEQKIKDATPVPRQAYVNLLQGPWTAYYYNPLAALSGNITRAEFWLNVHTEISLHVSATASPWNDYSGTATVLDTGLALELHSHNRRIYLVCELPENKKPEDLWILNGACVATNSGGKAMMANVIMVKNDQTLARRAKAGRETEAEKVLKEGHDAIAAYLLRKNKRQWIRPFAPNNFSEVKARNARHEKEFGRDNFDRLKTRLKSEEGRCYYAFNRHRTNRQEVAVFSYTFEFLNAEKIVWAARHRIGQPDKIEFAGEVVLEAEKIYMTLRDKEGNRRKQVIADFALDSDSPNVIKAITSTVSTNNAKIMGLRELIVYLPEKVLHLEEDEKTTGYISYQRFLGLPEEVLRSEDRLYLADRTQCTLSYPNTTDLKLVYVRQNKARNFANTYNLFVGVPEEKGKKAFLHILVIIDALAQVSVFVRYEKGGKSYRYEGTSEFFNHNLKIDVQYPATHTHEQRNLVLFFDQIQEKRKLPEVYSGTLLSTDENNNTFASPFVAITENGMRSLRKKLPDLPFNPKGNLNNPEPGIVPPQTFRKLLAALPQHAIHSFSGR